MYSLPGRAQGFLQRHMQVCLYTIHYPPVTLLDLPLTSLLDLLRSGRGIPSQDPLLYQQACLPRCLTVSSTNSDTNFRIPFEPPRSVLGPWTYLPGLDNWGRDGRGLGIGRGISLLGAPTLSLLSSHFFMLGSKSPLVQDSPSSCSCPEMCTTLYPAPNICFKIQ